jgi:hypothetical protein
VWQAVRQAVRQADHDLLPTATTSSWVASALNIGGARGVLEFAGLGSVKAL